VCFSTGSEAVAGVEVIVSDYRRIASPTRHRRGVSTRTVVLGRFLEEAGAG
jgi:hypothetical protein